MKPITILIGGDLAPTKSNFSYFVEGNIKALIDEKLYPLLNSDDYRIFNLEVPLAETEKPIKKDGPNLIAPVLTINGIKAFNPTILGLANNHILDHDEQGLFQTMELLTNNGINYTGAGKNLENASKPIIIEKDGLKIGVYACAENEFSIAEDNKAGANPFDPLESLDHITSLKSKCSFVIVLYHGGKEYYRYPSPYLQKVCRKMVRKGADLVLCQHSHCIGAYENYDDGIIVYGQGNFLMDRRDNEFTSTSLLVKASFGDKLSVDFVPICKNGNGIALPESDIKKTILDSFYERSKQILLPGVVEAQYDKYCATNGLYYLSAFAGFSKILRRVNRLLKGAITNQVYSLNKLNSLQNHIECEAHRELILRYLKVKRNKN